MSDVHERLRRLLFLVPYVSRHQGITLDELSRELGVSKEDLLEELDLLTFVGRPPFQPDDYIDIYVDDDRVYVDLDQRLSAPPRLTASEAAALVAAAELLRTQHGSALQSAIAKLEKVIPAAARARYREMHRKIDASLEAPTELGPLTAAIAERREVEFDYFAGNRGTTEHRVVQPRELFSHRGQWYLASFDTVRKDDRLFRLDRIQNLTVTDRAFEGAPAPRPQSLPNPAQGGEVRVRFSTAAAPYVKEQFGLEGRPAADGGWEVRVAGDSPRWLTQWVLSFGGEAEVLEPEWARQAVARAAAASVGFAAKP